MLQALQSWAMAMLVVSVVNTILLACILVAVGRGQGSRKKKDPR
jgi:hypothetical protein